MGKVRSILISLFLSAVLVSCQSTTNSYQNSVIILEKTACFGTCPIFKFQIEGNGSAYLEAKRFYKNNEGSEMSGNFTSSISEDKLKPVFNQFIRTPWGEIKDNYPTNVSDLPSTIITWYHKGFSKKVVITGKHPEHLDSLVQSVDALRRSADWKSSILN